MRRILLPLLLLSLACRAVIPATPTSAPAITPQFTPPSLLQPSPTPLPSPFPESPTTEPEPGPQNEAGFAVHYHPDGPLFVGDQVSLEVIPMQGQRVKDRRVEVQVDGADGQELSPGDFKPFGMSGREQATLLWAWDTSGLEAGVHTLSFSIVPGGPTWTETVSLQPASEVPPPEPGAQWATAESDCCILYYITGTAAERDLESLEKMADEQARDASQRLGTNFSKPIPITFLPRVLGHGGFTSSEIAVSYLDRNYAGNDPAIVLHHELVHLLDSRLGGDLRPTFLVEGLAVYLSGGHFKPEPLMPRAAALLAPTEGCLPTSAPDGSGQSGTRSRTCGLNRYLPLEPLIDNFYRAQHEIGYLEAGSLIQFMVETWGWPAFSDFYRDIHPRPGGSQAEAIDAALQQHFGLSLSNLEGRFLEALRQQPVSPALVEDVRLTVDYYDTMRRYQQELDPSAYFLNAWLPDTQQMREKGIVSDLLRRPSAPENVAMETLLVAADKALRDGDTVRAEQMLDAVNASLDYFSGKPSSPYGETGLLGDELFRVGVPYVAETGTRP